jgi:hypothetical protein
MPMGMLVAALLAATPTPRPPEVSIPAPPASPEADAPAAAPEPREDDRPEPPPDENKPKLTMVEKRAIATTPVGVFVRGQLTHRSDISIVDSDGVARNKDLDTFDISLDSARFSILHQIPDKWLVTEIEIEVSDPDQVELRDAYLLGYFGGRFADTLALAVHLEAAF